MSTDSVSNALYMYMNLNPLMLRNIREYYDRYNDCSIVSRKLALDISVVRACVAQLSL